MNKTSLNISGYQTKYNEMGETGNMRDRKQVHMKIYSASHRKKPT
jgi:hypothetical protein